MNGDLPPDEVRSYRSQEIEPPGFDDYWARALDESTGTGTILDARLARTQLSTIESWDLRFSGYDGQQIAAWLQLPRNSHGPLPCVVEFIGYGGGRGRPHEWLFWSAAGFAHLVVDTRGQGSQWRSGDTADPDSGHGPQVPGFMTDGILSPETYYYRRLITDAVRAIDAAADHPRIDRHRIAVCGTSQGGGLALAVAGLSTKPRFVMADVPFLCDYRRALDVTDSAPYGEIARYLKVHRDRVDEVFTTLGHFDGVNFAKRATIPALFSVALMDTICPPSTVYSAYNAYAGLKEIIEWPYNDHESGEAFQREKELAFARRMFAQSTH